MYDTPVSNEFIRAAGWKKEHLLSHQYRFLSVCRICHKTDENDDQPQENVKSVLQLT